MREMMKITLNLVVIFVAAGAILSVVFANTAPVIAKIKKEEKEKALKVLMPEADKIEEAGKWEPFGKHAEYYAAKDREGADAGYIASTYGKGYSSYINVLVGLNKDMTIKAIKVLDHAETPGLGDEIEQPYFQKRFEGKKLDQLEVVKNPDPEKIEAISGATISSRAVTKGVKEAVKFLVEKYQGVESQEVPNGQ
jgi:electron transport complex protein RnfG